MLTFDPREEEGQILRVTTFVEDLGASDGLAAEQARRGSPTGPYQFSLLMWSPKPGVSMTVSFMRTPFSSISAQNRSARGAQRGDPGSSRTPGVAWVLPGRNLASPILRPTWGVRR